MFFFIVVIDIYIFFFFEVNIEKIDMNVLIKDYIRYFKNSEFDLKFLKSCY